MLTNTSDASLMRRTLSYLFCYKLIFVSMVICMLAVAALEPLLPMIMKPLLDAEGNTEFIIDPRQIPYLFLAIIILMSFFSYARTYLGGLLDINIQRDLSVDMATHYLRLPISHIQNESLGKTTSRFTAFIPHISNNILPIFTALIQETVKTIVYIGWMFYLQWDLALIVILVVPFIALFTRIFSKKMKKIATQLQHQISINQNQLNEAAHLSPIIKLTDTTVVNKRLNSAFSTLRNASRRQKIIIALNQPLSYTIVAIPSAITMVIIIDAFLNQQMSSGDVVAFIGMLLLLPRSVRTITRSLTTYKIIQVAAQEIFSFLDAPTEVDNGTKHVNQITSNIEFDNVSFAYNQDATPVLKNISLSIGASKTIALVGRSGAGKTTLANMIPRFYLPTTGSIRIDQINIKNFTLASLRKNIALVTQEPLLFNDTVAFNVAYPYDYESNMDKVHQALESAAANDFVAMLPQGVHSYIGQNGNNLSGGQRQRLALARAFYRDAEIIILDEATSALDSETEIKIKQAIQRLFTNRTAIIITHRFSLIDFVDSAVVIDKGELIATGKVNDLHQSCPLFAELYQNQISK